MEQLFCTAGTFVICSKINKSVDNKMSNEVNSTYCLFCASPCSPSFILNDGELTRLKNEDQTNRGKDRSSSSSSPSSSFLEEEENSLLAQQLKVIFILKNILQIKDEKLIQFLGKLEGQFNPEFWVRLCQSCGTAVADYYETFKEVCRLQKKLVNISNGLKAHVEDTRDAHEVTEEVVVGMEETSVSVWKEVREELLNNSEVDVVARSNGKVSSNTQDRNSTEIIIDDGDILAEWNEEEGTLHLDFADLPSLKQILGQGLEPNLNRKVSMQEKKSNHNKSVSLSQASKSTSQQKAKPKPRLISPNPKPGQPIQPKSRRINGRIFCEDCPYFAWQKPLFAIHRKLHEPGAVAVTCSICKWLVHPTKLKHHNGHRHPTTPENHSKGSKHVLKGHHKYFKCPDCGALFSATAMKYFFDHKIVHDKGGGVVCTECGWLTTNLAMHVTNWHPEEGTFQAELRKRTANYIIIEVDPDTWRPKRDNAEIVSDSGSD